MGGDGCGLRSRSDVSQFYFFHQLKLPGGNICSSKPHLRRRFCSRTGATQPLVATPHACGATASLLPVWPSTMAPLCNSFVLFVSGSGDASGSRGWCCSCPAERVISDERCNKPHDSKGQLAAAVKASEEVGRGTMIAQLCEVWQRCEQCLQYRA